MLLGTAEREESLSAVAAASKIAKMCGSLPLYLTMVGRLVFEFGSDDSWETEVVAMLEEDRSSVLAQTSEAAPVGGGGGLGSKIVGGSLAAVPDPDAKKLLAMLAVAPDDVPIPMAMIELLWCAGTDATPPVGRLGLMRLRKHVFALLDRNLLLGETVSGVYMHDVVRDYSIGLSTKEQLRAQHRNLTELLLAAEPAAGCAIPVARVLP